MLIVGCGDVGRRVGRLAAQTGESPRCLVRSADSAAACAAAGLTAMAVDLDCAAPVAGDLAAHREIFYFAPPPPSGSSDSRMQRLLGALPATGARRIVYISTTGVYGNCEGAWVDETRPCNAQVDRARRRLDAERQLLAWRDAGGGEVIILRVAGIYGPGKLPLTRLQQQVPMIGEDDAPYTNRIHIDDLVTVCLTAMARGRDGEAYNVSDGVPGNMRDYFDRVADLFGLPRAPLISLGEARETLSPGMLSYLGESRRLDNGKMLRDLGITLRYPDLQHGLHSCLAEAEH